MEKFEWLQKHIAALDSKDNLNFDQFMQLILDQGFRCELVGGDENHGTYCCDCAELPDYSLAITKCHCGQVHYLEDMCTQCNPGWYHGHESHEFSIDLSSDLPF